MAFGRAVIGSCGPSSLALGTPHVFTDIAVKNNRVLFWKRAKTSECFQFSSVSKIFLVPFPNYPF